MRYVIEKLKNAFYKLVIFHPEDEEEVWICAGEEELVFRLASIFYSEAPRETDKSILVGRFKKKNKADHAREELVKQFEELIEGAKKQYEEGYTDLDQIPVLPQQPYAPLAPFTAPQTVPGIVPMTTTGGDTWGGSSTTGNSTAPAYNSFANVTKLNLASTGGSGCYTAMSMLVSL